jgi:ribosomal protein S18 acetylase RimI-like enzyme
MSSPLSTTIRLLARADGARYQVLRLQSLQTDPAAFLSTFETESALHESVFANHLDSSYHPPFLGYYGIFVGDQLAGYVQVSQNFLEKENHIVFLNNVYISPAFRKQGLGGQLFTFVFDLLAQHDHIERVYLSCTAKNATAYRFYRKMGFTRYGVRTKAIKWQHEYDDEIEMVKVL